MKIFGAGYNLALFEKYVSAMLDDARLDLDKAMPFLDVFLGDVFSHEALQAKPDELYLLEADEFRSRLGISPGDELAKAFLAKLSERIRARYLPEASPHWLDLERKLRLKLDYNRYCMSEGRGYFCPAVKTAEDLFIATLQGKESQNIFGFNAEEGEMKLEDSIKLDYHSWRCWFYSLWGQSYEWGRINTSQRWAEANGRFYQLKHPPVREESKFLELLQDLLDTHGFKVHIHSDRTMEYWR